MSLKSFIFCMLCCSALVQLDLFFVICLCFTCFAFCLFVHMCKGMQASMPTCQLCTSAKFADVWMLSVQLLRNITLSHADNHNCSFIFFNKLERKITTPQWHEKDDDFMFPFHHDVLCYNCCLNDDIYIYSSLWPKTFVCRQVSPRGSRACCPG